MKHFKITCFKYNLHLILASIALLFANLVIAQQVESPRVDNFTLVDADTGQTLVVYPNTADVNRVSLPLTQARDISFRFDTSNTGSVRTSGASEQARTENQLPFSLLGDSDNTYEPWSPSAGVYNIVVEPFSAGDLSGTQGQMATLELTVVAPTVSTPPTSPSQTSAINQILPAISYLLSDEDSVELSTSYTLDVTMTTSAGVFDSDDRLLRTLWSHRTSPAGTYSVPVWDGLDDDGNDAIGRGASIKIIANNITAEWEGVIGNTSASFTGREVLNHYNPYYDGVSIDGNILFTHHYSERDGSVTAIAWDDLQNQIELQHTPRVHPAINRIAYDGTYVYMAGRGGNAQTDQFSFVSASTLEDLDDDTRWLDFQGQTVDIFGRQWKVGDLIESNATPRVTGLAVQKSANNLFITRQNINSLNVIHKISGERRQTLSNFVRPKHTKVDSDDNLWFVHGPLNNEVIEKFTVNDSTGAITSTGFTITGFNNIQAVTFSPDGNTVVVSDVFDGDIHQVKGYSVDSGSLSWTLGRNESYSNDATTYNDKFMFYYYDDRDDMYGFLTYHEDGRLMVSDRGNARYQLFDANRNFLESVQWFEGNYSADVDFHDPERAFLDFIEFEVDYSKPLQAGNANDAWTMKANWGARSNIIGIYETGDLVRWKDITTLSNGRTYVLIHGVIDRSRYKIAELVGGGALRETNLGEFGDSSTAFKNDGRLVRLDKNSGLETYYEQSITGFDTNNNPIYGPETILAQYARANTPSVEKDGPHRNIGEQTSNGTLVVFDGGFRRIFIRDEGGVIRDSFIDPNRINDYHVGGIKPGDSRLSFATMKGVNSNLGAEYPINTNMFEVGNNLVFAGNIANAMDNWFMVGHNGEFWNNGQTNYRHMFHESGLPLIDFGTDSSFFGYNVSGHAMAGNAFDPDLAKVGDTVYLYHNDESYHAGLHRWKISNTDNIKEFNLKIAQ